MLHCTGWNNNYYEERNRGQYLRHCTGRNNIRKSSIGNACVNALVEIVISIDKRNHWQMAMHLEMHY